MILFDENCTTLVNLRVYILPTRELPKMNGNSHTVTQQLRPDFDTAKRFTGGSEYHYVSLSCTGM